LSLSASPERPVLNSLMGSGSLFPICPPTCPTKGACLCPVLWEKAG
jgi:hypothetical protein